MSELEFEQKKKTIIKFLVKLHKNGSEIKEMFLEATGQLAPIMYYSIILLLQHLTS